MVERTRDASAIAANVANASQLRLAGRWRGALGELDGLDAPEAWVERVQILSDEHLFSRDRGSDIEHALERIAKLAAETNDSGLEAFVASRRGLALHVEFLANPGAGEPPEEMPLFERALEIRDRIGDQRGVAESLFHIGLVHQIIRQDAKAALTYFGRSYELARESSDGLLMSYAVRHVGYVEQAAGKLEAAETAFNESLTLREDVGWQPGVAAARLTLAGVLAAKGDRVAARTLASSADRLLAELNCDRFRSLVADDIQELTAGR